MPKILITSAGSVNGVNVIKALQKEIKWEKEWGKNISKEYRIKLKLVAVNSDKLGAGLYMVDRSYVVPRANSKNFIPELLKICKKEKIDVLLPILSYEIPVIIENKKRFEKIGVKMAVSDFKTYKLTENKIETCKLFDKIGIPYPKIYTGNIKYPAMIKPIKDTSGAKNVHKIDDKIDLKFYKRKVPDSYIQEFVEGDEYTIDGLCDLNGKMIYALPRKRLEVKFGMAVKSITEYNKELIEYTRKIVETIGLVGAFNVQCIKNDKIYFIEVNNRFPSGGLPLTVGVNLNIPLDIIRMLMGNKIPPFRNDKIHLYNGVVMTRFMDAIILKNYENGILRKM